MDHEDWKRKLQQWHSPNDFRNEVYTLQSQFRDRLLTKAGLTDFYRDAYSASVFALLREAERVRLVEACRPDFEVKVLGRAQMFEVIEADTPGRKRGDEVRNQPKLKLGEAFPESYHLKPELAPQILETAAKRKDRDCYLPEWGLIIYLNPCQPGGQDQRDIEDGMAQATAPAKDRFATEVWVLWEGTAYNTWQGGALGDSVLRPSEPLF